jgi:cytidine deaminase
MDFDTERLKNTLDLCIIKKEEDKRSSSIAYSKSGESYHGAHVGSDTNLLTIFSEQVALLGAMQNNDFQIESVITMLETPIEKEIVSPIVIKILIDFARRTGQQIKYTVIDTDENVLFDTDDVSSLLPFYKPERVFLKKVENTKIESNKTQLEENSETKDVLKKYALLGVERNLPRYDSASGYGTAIMTKSGKVYFSGQYSSFDKRLNVHSEMAAVISALMEKDTDITHIGLVSTKHRDEPAHMCGCCRQFLAEMMSKFNINPELFLFAKDTDVYEERNISEYLSDIWTSKKW